MSLNEQAWDLIRALGQHDGEGSEAMLADLAHRARRLAEEMRAEQLKPTRRELFRMVWGG